MAAFLRFLMATLLLAVCHASEEQASAEAEAAKSALEDMDKDGNGMLTMEEMLATINAEEEADEEERTKFTDMLKKKFPPADLDGNGELNLEELAKMIKTFELEDEEM